MADIGCAGLLVEDTICGPLRELPPAGQLLELQSLPVSVGGCAANVAIDLARQGIAVDVAGCLGRDTVGEGVVSSLRQQGVGCDCVVYSDTKPTSKTIILLIEGQDRRYFHVFGANAAFSISHLDRAWVANLKALYIGGLYAMPGIDLGELRDLLKFCRERRVTTIVDVVVAQQWSGDARLAEILPYTDYFLPNDDEAQRLSGKHDPFDQVRYFRDLGARHVVVTMGKAGAIAARGNEYWRCGIYPINAIDPSGSGDAFDAGLISAIHRGADLPDMLRYASALGASATRKVGTTAGVFTRAEADAFVKAHSLSIESGRL